MRYPAATWKGPLPSSNVGGPMGVIRLGVFHIMEGTLAGTDSWFHNPAAQVSAHFGVGKDGTVYQWVDTSQIAYAQGAYNDVAISIEHEGVTGNTLTAQQIAADTALIAWLEQTAGIPVAMAAGAIGAGWLGHSDLGVLGSNHPNCPGAPILAQIPSILAGVLPPTPQGAEQVTSIEAGGYLHVFGELNGVAYHWFQPSPYTGGDPAWKVEKLPTS